MRFKPGISISYISRWVQVTATVFRYYKDEVACANRFEHPLFACPIKHLDRVERVKIDLMVKTTQKSALIYD